MENKSLHDFEMQVNSNLEKDNAVTRMVTYIESGALTTEQSNRLVSALHASGGLGQNPDSVAYGADFDMSQEISDMLNAVRGLRNSVFVDGKLLAGTKVSEAKDVLSMANSMIGTLMKNHEKLVNMERYRAVEQATIDCLKQAATDANILHRTLEHSELEGTLAEDSPLVRYFFESLEARLQRLN